MNSTVETDKAIARLPRILGLALAALGLAALVLLWARSACSAQASAPGSGSRC